MASTRRAGRWCCTMASTLPAAWVIVFGVYALLVWATFLFGRVVRGIGVGLFAAALVTFSGLTLNWATSFMPHVFEAALAAESPVRRSWSAAYARRAGGESRRGGCSQGLVLGFRDRRTAADRGCAGRGAVALGTTARAPDAAGGGRRDARGVRGRRDPDRLPDVLQSSNDRRRPALAVMIWRNTGCTRSALVGADSWMRRPAFRSNAHSRSAHSSRSADAGATPCASGCSTSSATGILIVPGRLRRAAQRPPMALGAHGRGLPRAAAGVLLLFLSQRALRPVLLRGPRSPWWAPRSSCTNWRSGAANVGSALGGLLAATMLVDTAITAITRRRVQTRSIAVSAAVERLRAEHSKLLVFVRAELPQQAVDPGSEPILWWGEPVMQALYWYNVYGFPSDVVVARDLGARDTALARRFPEWYAVLLTVRPAPPGGESGSIEAKQLESEESRSRRVSASQYTTRRVWTGSGGPRSHCCVPRVAASFVEYCLHSLAPRGGPIPSTLPVTRITTADRMPVATRVGSWMAERRTGRETGRPRDRRRFFWLPHRAASPSVPRTRRHAGSGRRRHATSVVSQSGARPRDATIRGAC